MAAAIGDILLWVIFGVGAITIALAKIIEVR